MYWTICMQFSKNTTYCIFIYFIYLPWLHAYAIYFSIKGRGHALCTVHSFPFQFTRSFFSEALFTIAPPQHKKTPTLQHNSVLLKIDPREVTHSSKQESKRNEQCWDEQEEELTQKNGHWTPRWFHLIICSFAADQLQWNLEVYWKTVWDLDWCFSGWCSEQTHNGEGHQLDKGNRLDRALVSPISQLALNMTVPPAGQKLYNTLLPWRYTREDKWQ